MLKFNFLVLGKSGSGKSSLLNYLWGEDLAAVGTGDPVTPESDGGQTGIFRIDQSLYVNNIEVVIYDSWGMEAEKADGWRELIEDEIRKQESSPSLSEWFHSIIYCVNAAGARIEDFEMDSVLAPLIEAGHNVVFALTKSDIASRQEIQGLSSELVKRFPRNGGILEVCSVSQTLRGGRETESFGKDSLFVAIIDGIKANLIEKLCSNYISQCRSGVNQWKERVLKHYDENRWFKTYSSRHKKVSDYAHRELESEANRLSDWLKVSLEDCVTIYHAVGVYFSPEGVARKGDGWKFQESLDENYLRWDVFAKLTNIVMQSIPVLNFFYLALRNGMHRDFLEEKLSEKGEAFIEESEGVAIKVKSYLESGLQQRLLTS